MKWRSSLRSLEVKVAVRVQTADFDAGVEINQMRLNRPDTGAIAAFVGQVRDLNDGSQVSSLTLEHYPGMTEKALEDIVRQAEQRWDIFDALVIHRVGRLSPTDQIVLVIVSGAHRSEAFSACEFIMDYLKTEAPFWKKEQTQEGERWVEAKASDDTARNRWQQKS
jgi:molybdopterin synthase catalytic subunit